MASAHVPLIDDEDIRTVPQAHAAVESPYALWQVELSFSQRMNNVVKLANAYVDGSFKEDTARSKATTDECRAHATALSRDHYDAQIEERVAALNVQTYKLKNPEVPSWIVHPSDAEPVSLSKKYPRCRLIGRGASSHVYLVEATPPQVEAGDDETGGANKGQDGKKDPPLVPNYLNRHPPLSKVVKAAFALPPPPHSPMREFNILSRQAVKRCQHIIQCLDIFTSTNDDYGWCLVLQYYPLTLDDLVRRVDTPISGEVLSNIFYCIFSGLCALHQLDIIHRDLKPSAILLASPRGPAVISDFGTSFVPDHGFHDEDAEHKILDVGTGPYRAPETLFGIRDYGPEIDIWAVGCMLTECARTPHAPLFSCPPAHEDGSQLMLIQSHFSTLGMPTKDSWPSGDTRTFRKPWDLWKHTDGKPWSELLKGVDPLARDLVQKTVLFDEAKRLSAVDARGHKLFEHLQDVHCQTQS